MEALLSLAEALLSLVEVSPSLAEALLSLVEVSPSLVEGQVYSSEKVFEY